MKFVHHISRERAEDSYPEGGALPATAIYLGTMV